MIYNLRNRNKKISNPVQGIDVNLNSYLKILINFTYERINKLISISGGIPKRRVCVEMALLTFMADVRGRKLGQVWHAKQAGLSISRI